MTIELTIPHELEGELRQRVGPEGDVQRFVIAVLRQSLAQPNDAEHEMVLPGPSRDKLRADIESAYQKYRAGEEGLDGPAAMEALRLKLALPERRC